MNKENKENKEIINKFYLVTDILFTKLLLIIL